MGLFKQIRQKLKFLACIIHDFLVVDQDKLKIFLFYPLIVVFAIGVIQLEDFIQRFNIRHKVILLDRVNRKGSLELEQFFLDVLKLLTNF